MATNFSDTTPAAPSGFMNVAWQADGSNNVSANVPAAGNGLLDRLEWTLTSLATGVTDYVQLPFACTIVGWSIIANAAGSISIEVDAKASSAPPTAPSMPNTSTDKISASAPIVLSSAQAAASASSGVSTWSTNRAINDVIGLNVASVTTITRARVCILVRRAN